MVRSLDDNKNNYNRMQEIILMHTCRLHASRRIKLQHLNHSVFFSISLTNSLIERISDSNRGKGARHGESLGCIHNPESLSQSKCRFKSFVCLSKDNYIHQYMQTDRPQNQNFRKPGDNIIFTGALKNYKIFKNSGRT